MRKLLATLLLLSSSALAVPTFVQKTTGINAVSTSTVTSGSITTTAGNFLIILLAENALTGLNNCSGQGATWNLLISNPGPGGGISDQYVLYAKNIPGATGAVTCTASAAQWMTILVIEYSGIDTVSPIDSSLACQHDSAATVATCGTLTPIYDSELLIGAYVSGVSATAPTATAPFTLRQGTSNSNEGSLRSDGEELLIAVDPTPRTISFNTANQGYRTSAILLKAAGANLLATPQRRGGVVSQ